jgi:hypothetical protein
MPGEYTTLNGSAGCVTVMQGLTLVHLSAQLKRFVRGRGCI